jgi:hypothetical protein
MEDVVTLVMTLAEDRLTIGERLTVAIPTVDSMCEHHAECVMDLLCALRYITEISGSEMNARIGAAQLEPLVEIIDEWRARELFSVEPTPAMRGWVRSLDMAGFIDAAALAAGYLVFAGYPIGEGSGSGLVWIARSLMSLTWVDPETP